MEQKRSVVHVLLVFALASMLALPLLVSTCSPAADAPGGAPTSDILTAGQ
ncbi:MAG: hypothetical protein KC776_16125 [Myxococcales bacterium]|nr:hypothetical protein [Myxococcales bacterium]MCB9580206.1 hypothetical protein [Polyangiaceae bacterium]